MAAILCPVLSPLSLPVYLALHHLHPQQAILSSPKAPTRAAGETRSLPAILGVYPILLMAGKLLACPIHLPPCVRVKESGIVVAVVEGRVTEQMSWNKRTRTAGEERGKDGR